MTSTPKMIVPAGQPTAAAWLADLFGLETGATSQFSRPGRFAVVRLNGTDLDFYGVAAK